MIDKYVTFFISLNLRVLITLAFFCLVNIFVGIFNLGQIILTWDILIVWYAVSFIFIYRRIQKYGKWY